MPYSEHGQYFNIGKQVKKHREELKMSQMELAVAAGVSIQTLMKIESGKNTNPTIATLASIANELEVSVDKLLGLKPWD